MLKRKTATTIFVYMLLLPVIAAFKFSNSPAGNSNPSFSKSIIFQDTTESNIPENLEECLAKLQKELPIEVLADMKSGKETEMGKYHFELGMRIRNGWGLWQGSKLSKYFNSIGIFHPDDMSGIIFTSLWRRLNGQDIKLQEQVEFYKRYWLAHADPKYFTCPKCKGKIILKGGQFKTGGDFSAYFHIGSCEKCKRLWAYEYDKGWYISDRRTKKNWSKDIPLQ